jgi:flavin reductase (DIM6/NTAB) family NADH-FMN oxidoreductase RutF
VAATGTPILRDALAWLDCRMHGRHQAGTHTMYVG